MRYFSVGTSKESCLFLLWQFLTDFCHWAVIDPSKKINLYAKFSHKSLILSKKVTLN